MAEVTIDGLRIAYDDVGDGPAVLFSHGFLMDRTMFEAQVSVLKDRFRCITWDQRGFGETGPVRRPYNYWDSARDALALLDHLGIASAVWVGLSQGGFLSMRAALLAPDRVDALVLMSTKAGIDTDEVVNEFSGLGAEWAVNGSANVQDDVAAKLVGDGGDVRTWKAKWAAMGTDGLAASIDALVHRDDITSRLVEISCPSLVLHGDADIAIDIREGEALASGLPGTTTFVRVAGAGHAPPLTHPDQTTAHLAAFLSDVLS